MSQRFIEARVENMNIEPTLAPPAPAPAPTPIRKRQVWLRYGATLAVGVLVGFALASSVNDKDTEAVTEAPAATVAATSTTKPIPTTTEAPTTTVAPHEWVPADFAITLTVIESSCFDTAGAVVRYEPALSLLSTEKWDKTATIIFEVLGGDSVETKSFDITPDGKYSASRDSIQTPRCSDVLTAVVTKILLR